MTTENLRRMVKATNKQFNMGLKDKDIDTILDLCDNNYMEELTRYIKKQQETNKVFITALGKQKFYEIKEALQ